jgi:hypothetical protein
MQQVLIGQISLLLVLLWCEKRFILKFHYRSAGYEVSGSSTSNFIALCWLSLKCI